MFGGSHESDFHNVTQYGSKMCHRSVTGVTLTQPSAVCDRSLECVQKYWSQWELGLLEGWLVVVEIGVVFLVPPCLYLHIIPMHHGQSGSYVKTWTSFSVTSCQSGNTVKTCITLW